MKKFTFFIAGMLCAMASAFGQSPPDIRPLSIGDTLPDITVHNVINYPRSTIKLSDFKGKVVILDFFATWCGACISALPRLDILQKQLGDKLQILVVDYEQQGKVKSFLLHNAKVKALTLPFITEDSLLSRLFPHRLFPHEGWIDKNGHVAAITRSNYVNAENIQALGVGKTLHLPLKKDNLHFDRNKPLLQDENAGGRQNLLYQSLLTRYLPGVGALQGHDINVDSTCKRLYYINLRVLQLYAIAAGRYFGNRLVLEVNDTSRYIDDGSQTPDAWSLKNAYCYQLSVPVTTGYNKTRQYMLQDLNRYLGLYGRWEKKRVQCQVLIRLKGNKNLLSTKGGKPVLQLQKSQSPKILQNESLSVLVEALNGQILGRPLRPIILDETHYTGKVDMRLPVKDIHNISALRKALQPYGLDIMPAERELEVFVLTEEGFH